MTPDETSEDDKASYRPACPFCGAAWTDAMLEELDAMTAPSSCACCVGGAAVVHWPLPAPASDLCCAACGRAIYRKL